MSDLEARMAAIIDGVIGDDCEHYGLEQDPNTPGGCKPCHEYAKRIAERLMPVVTEAQEEAWAEGHEAAQRDATRPVNVEAGHLRATTANPYRSNDE